MLLAVSSKESVPTTVEVSDVNFDDVPLDEHRQASQHSSILTESAPSAAKKASKSFFSKALFGKKDDVKESDF